METEYTKGFRAGMAWREAEIIKLLEKTESAFADLAIALIKGESNDLP